MKIIVCTRTLNESNNVERFVKGYNFADVILVSDGGSTDDTVEKLSKYEKVIVFDSPYKLERNGYKFNPDNPNINFILNKGLECDPDFLILDDFDSVPNPKLQKNARQIIENCVNDQINVFRLYMWGEIQYFPMMNNNFDPDYTSLWGWFPKKVKIYADESVEHGTIIGQSKNIYHVELPNCLLHYSWDEKTINEKVERYNAIGLPMLHPNLFAGSCINLPDWVLEE